MDKQSEGSNLEWELTSHSKVVLGDEGGDEGDAFGGKTGGPQRALSILPKNVWKRVFAYLKKDPKSLQSLSETCRSFQRILTEMEPPSRWELRVQEITRIIQGWRWYFNNWLLNYRTITVDSEESLVNAVTALTTRFWRLFKERFVNQMVINLPENGSQDEHTFILGSCLKVLGLLEDNLKTVVINCTENCPFETYQDGYMLISKVLGTLTKIETLRVSLYFAAGALEEIDELLSGPLPKVDSLTTLELLGYHYLPLAYLLEIGDKYGSTLKILKINHPFIPEEVIIGTGVEFGVLEALELKLTWNFIQPSLLINAPQLSSLTLVIVGGQDVTLTQLFTILDNFPKVNALRLDLEIGNKVDLHLKRFGTKRYPKVEYLCVERWAYQVPLDYFAKWFPNLVHLSLSADVTGNLYEDGDFKLILEESLEESGLWRSLQNLESIVTYCPVETGQFRQMKLKEYLRPEEFGGKGGRNVKGKKWILGIKKWTVILEVVFILVAGLIALWW